MKKIFLRKTLRELKKNKFKYIALFLLIVVSLYAAVSLCAASDTVNKQTDRLAEKNKLEDGEFSTFFALSDSEADTIKSLGAELEEQSYIDFTGIEEGDTIRVYKNRKSMNLIELDSGRLAEADDEVVLENRYAEKKKIKAGDTITLAGKECKVTGIGSTVDYDTPYANLYDSSVDNSKFSTCFVTAKFYDSLKNSGKLKSSEVISYAYRLGKKVSDKELRDCVKNFKIAEQPAVSNVNNFIAAEKNNRIRGAANGYKSTQNIGYMLGVLVVLVFSYVISVFVGHTVEKESSVIGVLYAQGITKRQLIFHYLTLPVLITFFAGVVGAIISFSDVGMSIQLKNAQDYFSLPALQTYYSPFMILYAVAMPPFCAFFVNYLVVRKKFKRTVLGLIKGEDKVGSGRNIRIKNKSFVSMFQIKHLIREGKSVAAVLLGLFMSLLIAMMGINGYAIMNNNVEANKTDVAFEYMYTYNFPDSQAPAEGEKIFAKSMLASTLGYDFNVTIMGLQNNDSYFDVDVSDLGEKVVLSSAMASKFNVSAGDKFAVQNDTEDEFEFTVDSIVDYSAGYYLFMNLNAMRKTFNQSEDYFNVILSDKELNIPGKNLFSVTTKDNIIQSATTMHDMMAPVFVLEIFASVLVFAIIMYLMIKVMIDRSANSISMFKIFGYNDREVGKLFKRGNFYIILGGAVVCIVVSKICMDQVYPYALANMSCDMNTTLSPVIYVGLYIGVIITYLCISSLLNSNLKKIQPTDLLKNRE